MRKDGDKGKEEEGMEDGREGGRNRQRERGEVKAATRDKIFT